MDDQSLLTLSLCETDAGHVDQAALGCEVCFCVLRGQLYCRHLFIRLLLVFAYARVLGRARRSQQEYVKQKEYFDDLTNG